MTYIFELACPRCGKKERIICAGADQECPHVNCGDCLWNDVEIVELKIISIGVDNEEKA
jgi:hypothetical protein